MSYLSLRAAKRRSNLYKLSSYFYPLPEALIAQEPLPDRDKARLLIIDRTKNTVRHDTFNHLNNYLPSNSHLIINNSKVVPARLFGQRTTGGAVEVFLLNKNSCHSKDDCHSRDSGNLIHQEDEYSYEVLIRPLKKLREGEKIDFGSGITAILVNKEKRIVRFNKKNIVRHLQKIGHVPLPPYIKRPDTPQDREDYQTVYAKQPGSVASPTAGLHFTKGLIKELKNQGHQFLELTLHINYGTFKPVECTDIRAHAMHTEQYSIKPKIFKSVIPASDCEFRSIRPKAGIHKPKKIVAVGTTSCRVLESVAKSKLYTGSTNIFIYPGHQFQAVDALITNFHLPYSTLLMLVCAFGGYDLVMKAYKEAIKKRYRFYSYGDAMLIL